VIQFLTEKGSLISARPSGTEPKIKFYISVNRPLSNKSDFLKTDKELDQLIADIESDFKGYSTFSTKRSMKKSSKKSPYKTRSIALIAHDSRKPELVEWAIHNKEALELHDLSGTGTTGSLIMEKTGLNVHCYKSGPLGGDQQIGAKISEGGIDLLIFFWDPLQAQPHDVDVKALLRLSVLYNIPVACNRVTADYLITSILFNQKETAEKEE
jgi:methylglyoxal synthase